MKKLLENRGSKAQLIWIIIMRLTGLIMFFAPLYLPIRAYFYPSIENVQISGSDYILMCVGFALSSGAKMIGILLNNVGIALGNLMNKITK